MRYNLVVTAYRNYPTADVRDFPLVEGREHPSDTKAIREMHVDSGLFQGPGGPRSFNRVDGEVFRIGPNGRSENVLIERHTWKGSEITSEPTSAAILSNIGPGRSAL